MRAAAFAELARTRRGKMRGGLRIAALGFGCELCSQLEDLVLVMRGQGLKQCEDVGDVVHFSSLGHPCVFGAGWNYNATARRLATGIFNREEAAQCQNIPAITSDRTVCMRRSSASTASARPSAGKPTRKYGKRSRRLTEPSCKRRSTRRRPSRGSQSSGGMKPSRSSSRTR